MYFRFLLTSFSMVAFGVIANAQDIPPQKIVGDGISKQKISNHARDMAIVSYPSVDDDCSRFVIPFGVTGSWGYVGGTNDFGDREKAQRLEFDGSAEFAVLAVLAYFETPGIKDNGLVTAKVYSVADDTGAPDLLLGTSDPLSVDSLVPPTDTSVQFTPFIFTGSEIPFLSAKQFFVSIDISELYTSNDTVGLFMTDQDCGDGTDSWELWSDTTWNSIFAAWQGLNTDFLLEAVVDFAGDSMTTSTDDFIGLHGLQLYPPTPNPAINHTILHYGLENDSDVTISVFDSQGKQLSKVQAGLKHTGRHQQEVFTHDFAPGTYYYRIATASGALVSRFMVQR